ncbi:hypothetical protein X760_05920 [Mesorhizobium sp. LSHC422A00]|uniref:hypothetical protein n=1 Tax=Mesorhizobium sp. LSHC422A00 TaxID=1287294 RepID=UPI0003CF631F|nr:hypothetical protein [Mesorhizobium sp. LSHC422A00]ESX62658.1 hypothetical protein X760_05920 [Mesorhizobium sp. LSHC422A00]
MFRRKKPSFSISIAKDALESIFDDCDKFDVDETGGRLIGTYQQKGGRLEIDVQGVLEAGPKAERTPTYFLQDGEYQEKLFRAIEALHSNIEHLGNWHTHHVNGYPTLSGGDHATYTKTVNHEKHNTDFFYALLVVSKNRNRDPRYSIKHFIYLRNDKVVYEIPPQDVRIIDTPALVPPQLNARSTGERSSPAARKDAINPERAKDLEFFAEFYPGMKALLSKSAGTPYWKGTLTLIDGIQADVVAMENAESSEPYYSVATSRKTADVEHIRTQYQERQFRSARQAVVDLERDLNQAIYRAK